MKDKEKQINVSTKEEIEERNKKGKEKDELKQALLHYATAEASGGIKSLIDCEGCAFYLYEMLGYRKIPEDSVVLSRGEYKRLLDNAIRVDMEYLDHELAKERKETAEKFANEIKAYIYDNDHLIEKVNNIAKEFGVEITIDDNCKYYDKANMRCNGAKCTPECYCNGHKSECTEYPETRKNFSCKIKE